MRVTLTPKLEQLVQEKVQSGLYRDESEVVRAALRLLQAHEQAEGQKLGALREALAVGEADIAAGRSTVLADAQAIGAYLARL